MQLLINFLDTHLYLLVALGAAVCFLVWLVVRQKSSDGERESRRTIWSYLFIWPLLLSKKQGDKTVARGLSKREWVGWLIVAVVIVLAVSLTPSKVRSVDAGVSERYAQSKARTDFRQEQNNACNRGRCSLWLTRRAVQTS